MPQKPLSTFIFSILIWMLLSFALLDSTEAQVATIGVKVGDWATYGDIEVTWDSEQMEPEPEVTALNDTSWYRNVVDHIVDTAIICNQTTHFKNDTQQSVLFHIDLYDGVGNNTFMFIPAKLRANDPLYPASIERLWINETTSRFSAGAIREVNYLNLRGGRITDDDPLRFLQISISYYWDRATGVLTSRDGAGLYSDEAGRQIAAWTMSEELVDTNLWRPDSNASNGEGNGSENVLYAAGGVAAGSVVLGGAWLFWRRRRKRFKRRKTRVRR